MALPAAGTDGKGNFPTNPFPLGSTAVGTPGTAVKLTSNFTDVDSIQAHWLEIRADDQNKGFIYVCIAPSGLPFKIPGGTTLTGADTTHFLNVLRVLSAGEVWDVPSWMMNMLRLGNFYIDGTQAADFVVATVGMA